MVNQLATLVEQFANYGITGDGFPEIIQLKFCFEEDHAPLGATDPLILVFVEWRLLESGTTSAGDTALRASLQQYRDDLTLAGFKARFISAKLYDGPVQKDGQIILALRRFVRFVYDDFNLMKGLVLIGRFPDAAIVRRVTWAPGFVQPRQLALQTGIMCERADHILGDMFGNWEELYVQNDFWMDDIAALPDADTSARGWYAGEDVIDCEFTSSSFEIKREGPFRDVFFIDDPIYSMEKSESFLRIRLHQNERNREISAVDYNYPNIMAKPELAVCRINAWHAAVNPHPSFTGSDGNRFLDANGLPVTVTSATPLFGGLQEDNLFTWHDSELEKELLVSYFKRNHSFRMGAFATQSWRAAIISGSTDFNTAYYEKFINNAATDFKPTLKVNNANLLQYVDFLKTPAVLKYILSHSFNRCSWFNAAGYTNTQLETAVGGTPFRWTYENGAYTPNFKTKDSAADMFVYRPLWQYKQFENSAGSLVIHGGCNVNSIAEVFTHRYTEHHYGHWHNAEGILFFTNCVALMARAKFFNDAPESFAPTFRNGPTTTFGDCWLNYFKTESGTAALAHMNVGRKRAYFWGICGDWTLRLRNRNGIGIFVSEPAMKPLSIVPDHSMIGNWLYNINDQHIAGTGDLDGDGVDEILIRSATGLAIVKYYHGKFKLLSRLAHGSNAGTWTLGVTDPIFGVADFIRQAQKDMLVWNSSGLAVLGLQNGVLTTIAHYYNNHPIGNWSVNTNHNRYAGKGVFGSESGTGIVVMGADGLIILSLMKNQSLCMVPSGSAIGAWTLDTAPGKDAVKLIADLDGDGIDEIVLASADKTGIFRLTNGQLQPIGIYPNGKLVGSYPMQSSHTFIADHYFSAASKAILVNDGTGLRFLALVDGVLKLRYSIGRSRIDGWLVEPAFNTVQQAGQLHPDQPGAVFIIRSGWGIGLMGFDENMQPRCYTGHAFGAQLGDWDLQPGNKVQAAGRLWEGQTKPVLLVTGG
ncbi:hypothetical protein [Pseudobacter ginsenosidimutans]|uniref:VCBS repeat protein n=1 Tax=Pseudobacter ginsenosidimutans TaxID=661488 RepID=A0A4Q7N4N2_9BACT|nr:hypothetical protein [Pseudobacter ginsenosidimutans]QEC44503.1 hypothetical protein FSB84_23530 [Pseudobacter ginsenosidimutans]RZS75974.1 hypothetical protein EV199_1850 [Pseudobacter ginsenosidimutans]